MKLETVLVGPNGAAPLTLPCQGSELLLFYGPFNTQTSFFRPYQTTKNVLHALKLFFQHDIIVSQLGFSFSWVGF